MSSRVIVLAPIHGTFFAGNDWYGLDLQQLTRSLTSYLPESTVNVTDLADVASDLSLLPLGTTLFFSPSYTPRYHAFVRDVAIHISRIRPDVVLIPNIDMLMAFENKGYQSLILRQHRFDTLERSYFGDVSDLPENFSAFPAVAKRPSGSMSSNVTVVQTRNELTEFVYRNWFKRQWERYRAERRTRQLSRARNASPSDRQLANIRAFATSRHPFVLEEYVPNLDHDFKVLAFGDRYYTLRRNVREGDFRASGSGKFEWASPPDDVLSFAKLVHERLQAPFLALDVAATEAGPVLFEFQGCGFGPTTILGAEGHHELIDGRWTFISRPEQIENAYAFGLSHFMLGSRRQTTPGQL